MPKFVTKISAEFGVEEHRNKYLKYKNKCIELSVEFEALCRVLTRYMKASDSVLVIDCYHSSLSADLFDNGFNNITAIDGSDAVVKQMTEKYVTNGGRNGLKFARMDVLDMALSGHQFNVVIDRGSVDAMAGETDRQKMNTMFGQMSDALNTYGRYVCISLLEPHVIRELLNWFSTIEKNWLIRIECCEQSLDVPVFAVICTKLQAITSDTIIEMAVRDRLDSKPKRLHSIDEVMHELKRTQELAFVRNCVTNMSIKSNDMNDVRIDLHDDSDSVNARYALYFVKYKTSKRSKQRSNCGVFIVPQRREIEWLFGSREGRLQLTKQSNYEQLIVVHLNRYHKYSNIEQIKTELSPQVLQMLPKNIIDANIQIPYLSIGEDVGNINIVYEGKSDLSGDYVIEDITIDDCVYRRLIFMNSQNIIQSEAKLKATKKGRKKGNENVSQIDRKYLACSHHEVITACLTLMPLEDHCFQCDVLLIGLGGGCLPSYIQHNIKSDTCLTVKTVEIDESMLEIATKWYELDVENKVNNISLEVVIDDGLDYINKSDSLRISFNAIMFDVDSKDANVGLSCPPEPFVDVSFLEKVKALLTPRDGIFILNLVARDRLVNKSVRNRVKQVFKYCFLIPITDELNEIIIAFSANNYPKWLSSDSHLNKYELISKHRFYIPLLKDCYDKITSSQLKIL